MSLLNQVLRDLDTRHERPASAVPRLQVVSESIDGARLRLWPSLVLIGLLVAGLWAYLDSLPANEATTPVARVVPQQMADDTVAAPSSGAASDLSPPARIRVNRQTAHPQRHIAAPTSRASNADADVSTVRIEKQPRIMNAAAQAQLAYERAMRAFAAGKAEQARTALHEALRLEPRHVRARELLVKLYIGKGEPRAADALLAKGLWLNDEDGRLRLFAARLAFERGEMARAHELLEHWGARDMRDQALMLLAAMYQREHAHAKAVTVYEAALKIAPAEAHGRLLIGLGISLEALGRHEAAHQVYERARHYTLPTALRHYADERLRLLGTSLSAQSR